MTFLLQGTLICDLTVGRIVDWSLSPAQAMSKAKEGLAVMGKGEMGVGSGVISKKHYYIGS